MQNGALTLESGLEDPQVIKHSSRWPSNSTSIGVYPGELRTYVCIESRSMSVRSSTIPNSQKVETVHMSIADEWINKMCYILYSGIFSIKRNEVLTPATV